MDGMSSDTVGEMRQAPGFMERGMAAVQELIAALREANRQNTELAERVRVLEQLAWTDPLTELPNRRGLDDQITREEARAARYGTAVAVALLDVNNLRAVNEQHGDSGGDALLRALGVALRASARGMDMVAHSHEDTFGALLPGADLAGAQAFLDRVRTMARHVRLPDGALAPIAFTAGVATREEAGTLAGAYDLADQRRLLNRRQGNG